MNKNTILQIGLGLSLAAIAVLLVENHEQQNTINLARKHILKQKRWMDIAIRLLAKDYLPVDKQEQLMIDLESYMIMHQNKII